MFNLIKNVSLKSLFTGRTLLSIPHTRSTVSLFSPIAVFPARLFSSFPIKGTSAREAYLFVYTCKVCDHRSERKISKHAYHKGVVLVQCPSCMKNHLVADNLGWFEDKAVNVEDLAARVGEFVWKITSEDLALISNEGAKDETTELETLIHLDDLEMNKLVLSKKN